MPRKKVWSIETYSHYCPYSPIRIKGKTTTKCNHYRNPKTCNETNCPIGCKNLMKKRAKFASETSKFKD